MNHKIFALLCVGLLVSTGAIAVMGLPDESDAVAGSSGNRLSSIYTTLDGFITERSYYVFVGAYVNVPASWETDDHAYHIQSINPTSSGLNVNTVTDILTGYVSITGTITVTIKDDITSNTDSVTINAAYQTGTNVSLYNGNSWTYDIESSIQYSNSHLTTNANGMTIAAGESVEQLTWTPTTDGSFKAVITVTSSNPFQCAIQTLNITVSTPLTPTATVSGTLYLVAGGSVPNTLREQVTTYTNLADASWTIEGTNNTGVTITSSGTFTGTAANTPGNHTLVVKATSGSNSATCYLTVSIVAKLTITSTPTGV